MSNNLQNDSSIPRADGVTPAERYLKKLCERTFLTLWSYAGLYRKQGQVTKNADGKELCDLLVVFENHIIIFSDKDYSFGNTGNLHLDWERWLRKSVFASAKQIWGAERWIKQFPDLIFLDRACTRQFPYTLPDPSVTQFHRIVVAHEAAERCKKELGGSGSLMIDSSLEGEQHFAKAENSATRPFIPFAIGHVDPSKGFVHVFDDTSLDIVLGALDTITDFVRYLTKKEQLLTSTPTIFAAGEEELLAQYLSNFNGNGERDFEVDKSYDFVSYDEGFWEEFIHSDARRSQIKADKVSYFWDELIEKFSGNILSGSLYASSDKDVNIQESTIRWLAREPRFRRRALAEGLLELARKTPQNNRAIRIVLPWKLGDPHYVFLLLPHPQGYSMDEYRSVRQSYLMDVCSVAKLQCPEAQDIIGIATASGWGEQKSEDLVYLDARDWSEEAQKEAEELQLELGLLTKVSLHHKKYYEYPSIGKAREIKLRSRNVTPSLKGSARNSKCPCGSGKKYKHCCGSSKIDK